MTAPCLSSTETKKQVGAPLAPGPVASHLVIPQPGRVPYLLLTPGSLGARPRPLVRALSCFSGLETVLGVFV